MLGEGPTSDINSSFGSPKKVFRINFTKAKKKFYLSLHYNYSNSYLFVNGKEIYKIKTDYENVDFLTQLYLGSISDKFDSNDIKEVSFKGNICDFSVDYNAIDNLIY